MQRTDGPAMSKALFALTEKLHGAGSLTDEDYIFLMDCNFFIFHNGYESLSPTRVMDLPDWKIWPPPEVGDVSYLVRGYWKPYDILKGGESYYGILHWGTFKADGSDCQWYLDFGNAYPEHINVELTHWTELPK